MDVTNKLPHCGCQKKISINKPQNSILYSISYKAYERIREEKTHNAHDTPKKTNQGLDDLRELLKLNGKKMFSCLSNPVLVNVKKQRRKK